MTKNIYQLYYYYAPLNTYTAFATGPFYSLDEAMKLAEEKTIKHRCPVYLGMFMSHTNVLMKLDGGHWQTLVKYEL